MNRLDGLADDTLVTTLMTLRSDIDDLKNRQVTSMASGVQGYFNQNTNTWDQTITKGLDTDTTTKTTIFNLAFSGDGSQAVTFANIGYALYANGNQLTIPNVVWTDGTRTAYFQPNPVVVSFNSYTLQIFVTTLKAVTLTIKFYVPASQRGTITTGAS